MPKVSVVVPVYRTAPYVEQCARSLFGQTLDDLEILFIDDCSPDRSVEIIERTLEEYPLRRAGTRIIRLPSNGGVAAARRRGILEAAGDFVIHCDSDDWADPDLYARMYDAAVRERADIVLCDMMYEHAAGSTPLSVDPLSSECREVLRNWYGHVLEMFCPNKLVRRTVYLHPDTLPWPGLNMWEDNGLMPRLFYYGGRLSRVHGVYYHYNRTNEQAMTAHYGERQVRQMIGIAQNLTDFFAGKPDGADFEKTARAFRFLAKIILITDRFGDLRRYRETFPGAESIVPELDERAFSRKGLVRFRMVRRHLGWLFILLYKIYGKVFGR